MPLALAGPSEQLFKVNSKLAPWVLLYKMSSASPVPHLYLLARFWEANAKPGSSSKKKNHGWVPQPSQAPSSRGFGSGRAGRWRKRGAGIIFDAGKEAPCFPFPRELLAGVGLLELPVPNPCSSLHISTARRAAPQPSPGGFLAWKGSIGSNDLL